MAIAFGAASTGEAGGVGAGVSSLTFSSPNISGSDTRLWVAAYGYRITALSTVTHNGNAMTLAGSPEAVEANRILANYFIDAPDAGTNDIVISVSGSGADTGIKGVAAYYTGVDQTGTADATAGTTTTGTSINDSVTTIADNCWVFGAGAGPGAGGIGASTGVTSRGGLSNEGLTAGDSNSAVTPAGSYSMTFTRTGSDSFGMVMASFAPAADAANTTNFFNMM